MTADHVIVVVDGVAIFAALIASFLAVKIAWSLR